MIVVLFIFFLQISAMQELPEPITIKHYTELNGDQKTYFDSIIDVMTNPENEFYFARSVENYQKKGVNLATQLFSGYDSFLDQIDSTMPITLRGESKKEVENLLFYCFNACKNNLPGLRIDTKNLFQANMTYLKTGQNNHFFVNSFYEILYDLFAASPSFLKTLENIQSKHIEGPVAQSIITCFLLDCLTKAIIDETAHTQIQRTGIVYNYKEQCVNFLRKQKSELLHRLGLNEQFFSIIQRKGAEALFKKMVNACFADNAAPDFSFIIGLEDNFRDIVRVVMQSKQITQEQKKSLIRYFQYGFSFLTKVHPIFPAQFESRVQRLKTIVQEVVIPSKTFPYKTTIFSVLLGVGGVLWYLRSHPQLFVKYPLLKRLLPFLRFFAYFS